MKRLLLLLAFTCTVTAGCSTLASLLKSGPVISQITQTPADLTQYQEDTLLISATITDSVSVTISSTVVYTVGGTFASGSWPMVKGSGDAWTARVPSAARVGWGGKTLVYHIKATNSAGISTESADRTDVVESLEDDGADAINPTISSVTQSPTDVYDHQSATLVISAIVTDNLAVSGSPTVIYTVDNTFATGTLTMTNSTDNMWTASIPSADRATWAGKTLRYHIKAFDHFGNSAESTTQTELIDTATAEFVIAHITAVTPASWEADYSVTYQEQIMTGSMAFKDLSLRYLSTLAAQTSTTIFTENEQGYLNGSTKRRHSEISIYQSQQALVNVVLKALETFSPTMTFEGGKFVFHLTVTYPWHNSDPPYPTTSSDWTITVDAQNFTIDQGHFVSTTPSPRSH